MTLGAVNSHRAELRHQIVVKYRSTTTNADGGLSETWTTRFGHEPAKFEQVAGGEFLRGRKIDVQTTAIFTVNYRAGYLETDRITFNSTDYGIVKIDMPDGIRRYLEIQAKSSK